MLLLGGMGERHVLFYRDYCNFLQMCYNKENERMGQ